MSNFQNLLEQYFLDGMDKNYLIELIRDSILHTIHANFQVFIYT